MAGDCQGHPGQDGRHDISSSTKVCAYANRYTNAICFMVYIHLLYRAARLQHASSLPNAIKQRIAVETLQVWAPLSFQVGLSNHIPELEVHIHKPLICSSCHLSTLLTLCVFLCLYQVHSYVLLFPQSFHSFVTWFDAFRPTARKVLKQFRGHLKALLEGDAVLPSLASKVRTSL